MLCDSERLPATLPLNFQSLQDLPSERMQFGFSFQDVPGLPLGKCSLVELSGCRIAMSHDNWDSVFIDVLQPDNRRIRFRGAGIPPNLEKSTIVPASEEWPRAALPLEIWSGNYGHWITYHLPKLATFASMGWQDEIVLPDRRRWTQVEDRDLTYLRLIEPTIRSTRKLRSGLTLVGRLALIDGDPHHPQLIKIAVKRILSSVGVQASQRKRRIFISRANAGYRKLVNETELLSKLEPLGFEALRLELLPLSEQVTAFADAECVIGMHGSGLANMVFCTPGTKIIEVIARDFPCPDFYRLAVTMELPYCVTVADSIGEAAPGYRDLVAPVEEIYALAKEHLE